LNENYGATEGLGSKWEKGRPIWGINMGKGPADLPGGSRPKPAISQVEHATTGHFLMLGRETPGVQVRTSTLHGVVLRFFGKALRQPRGRTGSTRLLVLRAHGESINSIPSCSGRPTRLVLRTQRSRPLLRRDALQGRSPWMCGFRLCHRVAGTRTR
jgi:hypothetical protein